MGHLGGSVVKCLTLAQVMISQLMSLSPMAQVMISWLMSLRPTSGSVLTAQSLELALDSVSPSLSALSPLTLCLCLSKINKY